MVVAKAIAVQLLDPAIRSSLVLVTLKSSTSGCMVVREMADLDIIMVAFVDPFLTDEPASLSKQYSVCRQ